MMKAPGSILFSLSFYSITRCAKGLLPSQQLHHRSSATSGSSRNPLSVVQIPLKAHDWNGNGSALQAIRAGGVTIDGEPSRKEILEVPISIETQEEFDTLPSSKRTAIVCRSSVLHLTLLSCFGPFVMWGAIRAASGDAMATTMALTPVRSMLWTLDILSWHAFHDLLNDYKDLNDDDSGEDSSLLKYGCHALY